MISASAAASARTGARVVATIHSGSGCGSLSTDRVSERIQPK